MYLGEAYSLTGEIPKAIRIYSNALNVIENIHDFSEKNKIILLLGDAYRDLGDLENALSCYKQVQQDARNEEMLLIMGVLVAQRSISSNKVYSAYTDIFKLIVADELSPKSLEYVAHKYKEVVDLENNLEGIDCKIRESIIQYKQELSDRDIGEDSSSNELNCWEEMLDFVRENSWHSEEVDILVILGSLGKCEEDTLKALEVFQSALEIMNLIGRISGKANVLKNLAELHQKLGSTKNALDYCTQALALAIELGIPLAKECEELKAQLESER